MVGDEPAHDGSLLARRRIEVDGLACSMLGAPAGARNPGPWAAGRDDVDAAEQALDPVEQGPCGGPEAGTRRARAAGVAIAVLGGPGIGRCCEKTKRNGAGRGK